MCVITHTLTIYKGLYTYAFVTMYICAQIVCYINYEYCSHMHNDIITLEMRWHITIIILPAGIITQRYIAHSNM